MLRDQIAHYVSKMMICNSNISFKQIKHYMYYTTIRKTFSTIILLCGYPGVGNPNWRQITVAAGILKCSSQMDPQSPS